MKLNFDKYQGTGNDFVMIDNMQNDLPRALSADEVNQICDRRFGIGADGLIILEPADEHDFKMVYYNSDGNQSTMCGNGGRCAVAFAKKIGIIIDETSFLAIDGEHHATISNTTVSLGMQNVVDIISKETFHQLDTGSPHYVAFVEDINDINVAQEGALIRNSPLFKEAGINVNFVEEKSDNSLFVRTYERGVEDETLSCGTGVTAASLVQMMHTKKSEITVETLGGHLKVRAQANNTGFENIKLIGPATFVFQGVFETDD